MDTGKYFYLTMKLKLILLTLGAMIISGIISGVFFSTYFLVSPVYIKLRNPIVKRTSAQEYAEREARMIKDASLWILDYQQDEATRLRFSEDVKNIMEK